MSLVLFTYAADMQQYVDLSHRQVFRQAPHCFPVKYFWKNDLSDGNRLIDVLLVGNTGPRVYSEVAMAGALIVRDIPHDREKKFRRYVVEVNMEDSDEKLVRTVQHWLKHPQEREKRARVGQPLVGEKSSTAAFVDNLIEAFMSLKKVEYGLQLTEPLHRGCAATNLPAGKTTNAYCRISIQFFFLGRILKP